jgi:hypothetical protein
MFLSKRGKALFACSMALVQTIAAVPGLAAEPAPLDDIALNEATTDAAQQDPNASPSRKRAKSLDRGSSSSKVARIVQTTATELPNPVDSRAVLVLSPQSDTPGLPDASQITTNLVISATLSSPGNVIRP